MRYTEFTMWLTGHLKHFFVPAEANGFVPAALSRRSAVLYFVLAFGLTLMPVYVHFQTLALLSAPATFGTSEMVALVNAARADAGLGKLAENTKLNAAAAAKVEDMFAHQYFAHFAPGGTSPWDFFKQAEYVYSAAGENLALDFVSADAAHEALMHSPTHRANILNTRYTEIGIAVRQGEFQGRPAIIIAQYFGSPRAASAPAPKPAATAPKPAAKPSLAPTSVLPKPAPAPTVTAPVPLPRPAEVQAMVPEAGRDAETARLFVELQDMIASVPDARIVALLAIASLAFPLLLLAFHGGASHGVMLRAFALILVFGAVAVFGAPVSPARITAEAPAFAALAAE